MSLVEKSIIFSQDYLESSNSIIKKKDWNLWIDAGKNVVRRENIEAAVRRVMDDGDDDREG
ncbi:unnamed protein product [Camellia sinensis]